MTKPKRFSFTVNNPTAQKLSQLQKLAKLREVEGMCWQMEVGANGTYHFQGYLYYGPGLTIRQVRRLVEGIIVDGFMCQGLYQMLNKVPIHRIYIDSDESGEETAETVILSDNE